MTIRAAGEGLERDRERGATEGRRDGVGGGSWGAGGVGLCHVIIPSGSRNGYESLWADCVGCRWSLLQHLKREYLVDVLKTGPVLLSAGHRYRKSRC